MAATLEVESTLTDRYQTTVPETVRRALQLGKRDKKTRRECSAPYWTSPWAMPGVDP